MKRLGAALGLLAYGTLLACGAEPQAGIGQGCGGERGCEADAFCLVDPLFPGGYCTIACADADCASGSRCVSHLGEPLCLAECSVPGTCREGYQCWRGACQPICSLDRQCGPDARCEGGRCAPLGCDAGAADCEPGIEPSCPGACGEGFCLPEALGGGCAARCTQDAECDVPAERCAPLPEDADGDGAPETTATACAPTLPGAAPSGSACDASAPTDLCEGRSCVLGRCAQSCATDASCLPGETCTPIEAPWGGSFLGCALPDPASAPALLTIPLGRIGIAAGTASAPLAFVIPDEALSFSVSARRVGGDADTLAFARLEAPGGELLFDYISLSRYVDPPIRWLPIRNEESICMLVPNTTPDRVALRGGRYELQLTAPAASGSDTRTLELELSLRIRRALGTSLDLDVFLVGVGLDATQAPSDPRVSGAIGELERILASAGLGLGTLRYLDVPLPDAEPFSILDSADGASSEAAALMRAHAGSGDAINLYLVRTISEAGSLLLGYAAGLPGAPGVHGSANAGVIISFDPLAVGSDPLPIGQVMAHEIGHYLGLFHTREALRPCLPFEAPGGADPCAPFGAEDVLIDTDAADGTNLMYFALGGADGITYNDQLSDGQRFVLQRSTIPR
ncbi:MAG: hypothetical protein OEY14_04815 [Myxococcales bacterium]|nr:hypothetical protein [Myxococcales bacterium]